MKVERRTVHYTGRVQGVGFRWRALRAVEGLELDGYVRNLRDGRVLLVLEGDPEEIDRATRRIREAVGAGIAAEDQSVGQPTGEFEGFQIRR